MLLRDAARPERVYAGRAELHPGEVVFVGDCDGTAIHERVAAADLVSARRSPLRLRSLSSVELALRSGRRIDVAVPAIGGLSLLLEALAAAPVLAA